jgi:small conductance mechanosensitive channel
MFFDLMAQDQLDDVVDQLADIGGLSWQEWMRAGIVLLVAIGGARLTRDVVRRGFTRAGMTDFVARILARFLAYAVITIGVIYALASLGVELAPVLGALGIAGLAFALAFQSIAENFIAGIILLIRRPFVPGDQIATGDHEGTVEDVNLRVVVLTTYDGETVHVPNASVLDSPIENYTKTPLRRTTLPVGVAYATDLELARRVLLDAVSGVDGVEATPPPEALVHDFGDSSIDFAVRFWHVSDIATLWRVRDGVARAVKPALDTAGIEIPFPQRTVWMASATEPAAPGEAGTAAG